MHRVQNCNKRDLCTLHACAILFVSGVNIIVYLLPPLPGAARGAVDGRLHADCAFLQ